MLCSTSFCCAIPIVNWNWTNESTERCKKIFWRLLTSLYFNRFVVSRFHIVVCANNIQQADINDIWMPWGHSLQIKRKTFTKKKILLDNDEYITIENLQLTIFFFVIPFLIRMWSSNQNKPVQLCETQNDDFFFLFRKLIKKKEMNMFCKYADNNIKDSSCLSHSFSFHLNDSNNIRMMK